MDLFYFFFQSGEIKTVNEINECIETLNTSWMQKAEPTLQRHILFAAPPQQHYLHADRWRKRRQRSGTSYTKTSLLLGHMWSGRNSLRCVTQLCWGYTLPCCKSCPARWAPELALSPAQLHYMQRMGFESFPFKTKILRIWVFLYIAHF